MDNQKTAKNEKLLKAGLVSGVSLAAMALVTGITLSQGGITIEDAQPASDSSSLVDKPTNTTPHKSAILAIKTISSKRSTILELANTDSVLSLVGSTGSTDIVFDEASVAEDERQTENLSLAIGEIESLMSELSSSPALEDTTIKSKYDKLQEISDRVLPSLKDIVVQGRLLTNISYDLLGSSLMDLVNGDIDMANLSLSAIGGYMTEIRAAFSPLAASSNKVIADFGNDVEAVYSAMIKYMEAVIGSTTTDYSEITNEAAKVMNLATALSQKYLEPDLGIEYFFSISESDLTTFFDAVDDLLAALEADTATDQAV